MLRHLINIIAIVFLSASLSLAGPRDSLWSQVESAIDKGLPQTAIGFLEEIIPAALQDESYAELVKAITLKISLEGRIQGNLAEEKITRLQTEIGQAPEAIKPLLEVVQAYWFWEYFQQNQWRFLQRTQTAEPPGEDFTTWDLPRILAEIDTHLTLALDAEQTLKTIPIEDYDFLLERGTVPDSYQPTLYDFVAKEALAFYSAAEQAGSQPQDAFVIKADTPIFASISEFLAWAPQTSDTSSAKLKAIRLYQDLLTFHQNDVDPSAFLDTDLHRLRFGYNYTVGPDKDALYETALERFVDEWSDHELSAEALYAYASLVHGQGDFVRAHALAEQGMDAHPDSIGGKQCYTLFQQIEARYVNIQTERVWTDPLPDIVVTYRNITQIYFRIVPGQLDEDAVSGRTGFNSAERDALLATEPILEWHEELPATLDYQQRTEALSAPAGIDKGIYFLIASHDPSFAKNDNRISVTRFWVSDLAMVVRSFGHGGVIEGFVLNAKTGEPIADATVTQWIYDDDYTIRQVVPGEQTQTNSNGLFRFSFAKPGWHYLYLLAEHEGDRLTGDRQYYISPKQGNPSPVEKTVFFTDRAIYRPGQTVHYKGICLRQDRVNDNYTTLANKSLTVVFRDTNGQEIVRRQHQTNDYGSFSGSFTAPHDRLLGRMSLYVQVGPSGSTYFNIEEYKRPKFHVQLDPPEDAPKLDTEVIITGKATAYTGAAVDGAQVNWRVQRQVRFPIWNWWARGIFPSSNSQAIEYGSSMTASDGSFDIGFTAKPDLSVSPEDEPVFVFQIHADVTDTTGETRSDTTTISVGYTALQATIQAEDWQTSESPVSLTILTDSLDGQPEPATGTLKVFTLQQPERVSRASLLSSSGSTYDPETWDVDELVYEASFQTDALGQSVVPVDLDTGIYRAVVDTEDRFGTPVTAQHTITVVAPEDNYFNIKLASYFAAPTWSLLPGESFLALWGTGYDKGRAFVEVECRGDVLYEAWTDPNVTQTKIEQEVTENMRGGFTVRVTYVRENRAYIHERIVDVPWINKELSIQWERFRSLLEPGQQEEWTAIISGPDAQKAVAEMVAGLYDASLDLFLPHTWMQSFGGFRQESSRLSSSFNNHLLSLSVLWSDWGFPYFYAEHIHRHFPNQITYGFSNYLWAAGGGVAARGGDIGGIPAPTPSPEADSGDTSEDTTDTGPDLDQVDTRTNFDETAFFYPRLVSNANGEVRIEFTMPEALTQWRFLGFAHDNALRSGFLTDTTITAKDLMVQANAPRFVREGDVIEFTVKVTNQSAARQTGKVRLTLTDARNLASRDADVGNLTPEQTFDVPSHESRTYAWRLSIPDGCEMLIYKVVGATDRLSDGEENYLPVLSRRILVTESLALSVRGAQTKDYEFTKLINSSASDTLRHQSLTVQMVSQPAWYAVMALPYLMESQHECSERIFNRFYANTLAAYIANADPGIRQIFDQWKATDALDSPLEQNEDLKAVILEETPWVRQAVSESQARKQVGILFDENRLKDEMSRTLFKLKQMQRDDGLWPWFPGLAGNRVMTLYITTGFGRLRHLGVNTLDVSCAIKSLDALDDWMNERYRWILEHSDPNDNHLSPMIALYLYGRSFFLTDKPMAAQHTEALEYWLSQARQNWLSLWRQSQAHLAIALKRFGDLRTPLDIMQSIREYSVIDEELGMYWRDLERSWWWYRAPIETQAMMIEAFDEVLGDAQAVEDCRVWLLKQKQTQDWKTTRATADAIYALLLRGTNWLSSNTLVEVALAGQWIEPEDIEAGTGFYEKRFIRNEIQPDMGYITVRKVDEGISWGSLHWQYLEDIAKVTPYEGTPLQLRKDIFVKKNTAQGQTLFPVQGPLAVGDELVVRIEIRVDRDMEYVHLKDQRGSGTEPVDVLSGYRYQDGLGYYQTTRDTATHFFADYLPKGTYVLEYSTRIQHKGVYQTGIASIQCLYAPEFNSHSESFTLTVE